MSDTLRSCIVAEEGYSFISLDANQIELRVLAILSQDPKMLEDLATGDLHQATADRMGTDRYTAKQANFAMIYGADEFKLAEMLSCSVEEALAFMEEHKKVYSTFYAWAERKKAEVKEVGYTINIFGRIRPIPELESGSFRLREKAEREIINTIIQSSAVDIVKLAGIYLRQRLDPQVRFILQVHDEWLLECPNHLLDQSLQICYSLRHIFTQYPFTVKVGTVYSQLQEKEEADNDYTNHEG